MRNIFTVSLDEPKTNTKYLVELIVIMKSGSNEAI